MESRYSVTSEFGGRRLELSASKLHDSWFAELRGGDLPHNGACALAETYTAPDGRPGVSCSVISRVGHRDGDLAGDLARSLAKALELDVFLLCGIHFDDLDPDALAALIAECRAMSVRLIESVTGGIQ